MNIFLFGLVIWYFWFGLECFLNGVIIGGYLMPFRIFWSDFKDGFKLFGCWHALFTHVFIPSAPYLLYKIAWLIW